MLLALFISEVTEDRVVDTKKRIEQYDDFGEAIHEFVEAHAGLETN